MVQDNFIKDVGPYLNVAKAEGKLEEFYTRVYSIWFQRWPVVGEWYGDQAHIDWAVDRHKKVSVAFDWVGEGLTRN